MQLHRTTEIVARQFEVKDDTPRPRLEVDQTFDTWASAQIRELKLKGVTEPSAILEFNAGMVALLEARECFARAVEIHVVSSAD